MSDLVSKEKMIDWCIKMIDCEDVVFNFIDSACEVILNDVIIIINHRLVGDTGDVYFNICIKYTKDQFLNNGELMRLQHNGCEIDEMEYNNIITLINNKAYIKSNEIESKLKSYFRGSKLNKLID